MNPVASNVIEIGVSTQLNKMSFKSSSLFVSSSDDGFFSEGIQPYSYETRFDKARVVYDGKHGLEEETDDQEELAERICNTDSLKCSVQTSYESFCCKQIKKNSIQIFDSTSFSLLVALYTS